MYERLKEWLSTSHHITYNTFHGIMLHHTSCHSLYHISTRIWYHNINHIIKSFIISNAVFASISSIHMLLTTIHHYQSNLIIISFDWETINDQIFAFICWDDESIFIASIVCSCITFYLYQILQSRYNQFFSSFLRFFSFLYVRNNERTVKSSYILFPG